MNALRLLLVSWILCGSGTGHGASEAAAEGWPGLGRLFNTPQQREALERIRQTEGVQPLAPAGAEGATTGGELGMVGMTPAQIPKGPRYLTVGGLVLREEGKSSVWLNRRQFEAAKGHVGENYRLEPTEDPSRGVWIRLVDAPKPFLLVPGMTLDAEEKIIRPSHEIPAEVRYTATRGGDPEEEARSKAGKSDQGGGSAKRHPEKDHAQP
ncbi:MAG: hypothetical protein HQL91_01125 [Magnetococcales bacterium]|nr:hypothetical protein [Magnetococcales bacterium]